MILIMDNVLDLFSHKFPTLMKMNIVDYSVESIDLIDTLSITDIPCMFIRHDEEQFINVSFSCNGTDVILTTQIDFSYELDVIAPINFKFEYDEEIHNAIHNAINNVLYKVIHNEFVLSKLDFCKLYLDMFGK